MSEIKYETRTVGRRRCRSLPNGLPGRVREPVNIIKVSVNKRFCMSRPFFFHRSPSDGIARCALATPRRPAIVKDDKTGKKRKQANCSEDCRQEMDWTQKEDADAWTFHISFIMIIWYRNPLIFPLASFTFNGIRPLSTSPYHRHYVRWAAPRPRPTRHRRQ